MLDSVHLARWLSQFKDRHLDIRVLPSTYFRQVHPKLLELSSQNLKIPFESVLKTSYPYFDYFFTFSFLGIRIEQLFRRIYIFIYIKLFKPQIIHALEIQHAGYIVKGIKSKAQKKILTNWGSDIYYFQNKPDHVKKIRGAIKWATHYSAECARDYELAKQFGFSGINLPKIPNAGGFEIPLQRELFNKNETQILIKCYGGTFGLGELALRVADKFLSANPESQIFLYSVTDDLYSLVHNLCLRFPHRVTYSLQKSPLLYEELAIKFQESIIYLGLSRSDGLSTSFLEALVHCVYPIQTNTSCASELISEGAIGSVISPDLDEIYAELERIYQDKELIITAVRKNFEIARKILDKSIICEIAQNYYL